MKHFLKMLEVVNEQGGVNYFDFSDALVASRAGSNATGWQLSEALSDAFYSHAKMCQPFVFSVTSERPLDPDLSDAAALEGQATKIQPLDLPFKVVSIEMLSGSITVPRPTDIVQVYTECLMVVEAKSDSGPKYYVYALSRNESAKDPSNRYFVSVEAAFDTSTLHDKSSDKAIVIRMETGEVMLPNAVYMNIIRHFLDRLESESAGAVKVNERLRVGRGASRGLIKIKRIIHISPKRTEKRYGQESGLSIDWSHRWFSRGHWRYSTPEAPIILGKDRDGNYVEHGRTWVTESIKGPNHKELIIKTRLVEKGKL